MTTDRALDLVRELDALRPTDLDRLPIHRRALYRAATETAAKAGRIRPRHAQALRLALTP